MKKEKDSGKSSDKRKIQKHAVLSANLLDDDKLSDYNKPIIQNEGDHEMDIEPLPQYERIAINLASRILSGELEEQEKISGRSMLASEYSVSPETIRKALGLLADMKVVEVQPKSGVYILSRDNARRYVQSVSRKQEEETLYQQLHGLIEEYQMIGKRVFNVAEQLHRVQEHPLPSASDIPNYEVKVVNGSSKTGRSLASLRFWQSTGATIIAIRRNRNTILSPGPFAELYPGDVVIFVGEPESVEAVERFLNEN